MTGASGFLEDEAHAALRVLADRPALLPWGDRDPVFSSADRDRLVKELPNATVHPLSGAGHFQEDAPEEIAAAVRDWWR